MLTGITATPLELWAAVEAVPAGYPSPAQDYMGERIDLTRELVKDPTATFLWRVSGDSMEGAGIFNGDVVLVDRSLQPTNNSVVLAVLDGEHLLKRLRLGRGVELVSENPRYRPIRFSELSELTVFGVVTYAIHRV